MDLGLNVEVPGVCRGCNPCDMFPSWKFGTGSSVEGRLKTHIYVSGTTLTQIKTKCIFNLRVCAKFYFKNGNTDKLPQV